MRSNGSDKANAFAAIDLLLNLLMLFIVISAIAIVQMNPPSRQASMDLKAELVVELTWAERNLDDLDLWVLLPNGRKVGFTNRDAGVASLDRDDRGGFGEVYPDDKGELKLIEVNKEAVVVRANIPGRYVVNVHYFHNFSEEEVGVPEADPAPDPALAKLTKLNPRLVEVASQRVTLGKVGSQRTAFCFEVDAAGAVSHVDTACDVPFVSTTERAGPGA